MSVMGSEVNRLLKKIKDGDLTKREELFKITAGHLLGVARRYLYHAEDAEDVVAETFVRAFRYIHAYDESQEGYNWLCKIAQHLAFDHNEQYKAKTGVALMENRDGALDHIMEKVELETDFVEVLGRFSLNDQHLIYLRFWEHLSYREISARVGKSKSLVAKSLKIILKEFFKIIEKEWKND